MSKMDDATDADFERLTNEIVELEAQVAKTMAILAALRLPIAADAEVITDDFGDWLALGIERGWASEQFCMTHEPAPTTDAECELDAEGVDFCVQVVRLGSMDEWEADASSLAEVMINAAARMPE